MLTLNELPQVWQEAIKAKIERDHLESGDFRQTIQITFEDGSRCRFNYVLFVEIPWSKEFAVLTEHCGYHLFPLEGTRIHFLP